MTVTSTHLTNIRFSQEERHLLKYGLNYSIEKTGFNLLCQPDSRNRRSNTTSGYKDAKHIPLYGSKRRQLYVVKEFNNKLAT